MIKFSKKTKTLFLISFLIFFILGIFGFIKFYPWFHQEWNEHYPFHRIRNVPQDNGIPRLMLYTDSGKDKILKDKYSDGSFKLFDKNEKIASGKIKIKGRGNTTWRMPKKPYALKLDKKQSLLNMPKDSRYNLLNSFSDKSLVRTTFALHLGSIYDNLGYTPQTKDVEVFFNNKYYGYYNLTEKIKIAKDKINIPDISKVENLNDGGYFLEIGRLRNDFYFATNKGVNFALEDPEVVSEEAKVHIQNQIQTLEDSIFADNFADKSHGYRKYLDINSFIDWYIINEFTKNHDAKFIGSVNLYYNPYTQKVHFGPIWDFDISCGNCDYNNMSDYKGFWVKDAVWINRIFEDPEFVKQLKVRWNEKKNELHNAINSFIPERVSLLDEVQKYNFKAWTILGIDVWPNAYIGKTYDDEVNYLLTWLNNRYLWFDNEINSL